MLSKGLWIKYKPEALSRSALSLHQTAARGLLPRLRRLFFFGVRDHLAAATVYRTPFRLRADVPVKISGNKKVLENKMLAAKAAEK